MALLLIILGSYSPDSAAAILQASAAEAEQNSEVIADGFVRGEIDVRDFLKEFLDARTKSYDLKVSLLLFLFFDNIILEAQGRKHGQSLPVLAKPSISSEQSF